jgi:hypothetical protein
VLSIPFCFFRIKIGKVIIGDQFLKNDIAIYAVPTHDNHINGVNKIFYAWD